MPNKEEMATAYVAQVEAQLAQLKAQTEALEQHLEECQRVLEQGKETNVTGMIDITSFEEQEILLNSLTPPKRLDEAPP